MGSYIGRATWHNWEQIEWWPFVLDGDWLVSDSSAPPIFRSVADLEADRPLYLRLADAVERRSDGDVVLNRKWRQLALDFANSYFPPVASTYASPQDRIPVARFGHEALLISWTLRLRQGLAEAWGARGRRAGELLLKVLTAVVQIQALVPEMGAQLPLGPAEEQPKQEGKPITRVRKYLRPSELRVNHDRYLATDPRRWISTFAPMLGTAGAKKLVEYVGTPRGESGGAYATESLSRGEAMEQVKMVRTAYADDIRSLWWLATNVLASLLNLKLIGAILTCHATGRFADSLRGGFSQVSVGFRFMNPLARIWFGLWEDWRGTVHKFCDRCGKEFPVTQKTKRFCSTRCQEAASAKRHRDHSRESQLPPKPKARPRRRA